LNLLFRPKINNTTKIRYDIQFLRAIAVLAVVIYHLFPTKLVGGFMGVDVFFVISGYLMTKSLIKDFNQGYLAPKFTGEFKNDEITQLRAQTNTQKNSFLDHIKILARFYARRIKRLAPAASFCLIVVLGQGILANNWVQTLELSKQVFASGTFWQNIYLYFQGVDYTGQYTPDTAVQHFWSLSLEEQFYMIWPILLLISLALGFLIFRKNIKTVPTESKDERSFNRVWIIPIIIIIIFTLVFFGAGYYLTKIGDFVASYFLTPARIWELSLGGIICFLPTYDKDLPFIIQKKTEVVINKFTSNIKTSIQLITPWVGLFFTAWALIRFTGNDFPGWKVLVPTLGTFLIIYGGSFNHHNISENISDPNLPSDTPQKFSKFCEFFSLSNFARFRPFQSIGDASYSIYLYYCPVITLVPLFLEIDLWQGHRLLRIVLFFTILILGFLSYYLIEQPTRKYKFQNKATLKTILCGIFLMLVVIAFSLLVQNFAQKKVDIALKDLTSVEEIAELDPDSASSCFGAESILNKEKCQDVLWTSNKELEAYATEDRDMVASLGTWTGLENIKEWTFGDPNASKTILLCCDSKAGQYSNALDFVSKKLGYQLVVIKVPACPAQDTSEMLDESELFYFHEEQYKENCFKANQIMYEELIPNVDLIFLASSLFRESRFNSQNSNQNTDKTWDNFIQKIASLINHIDSFEIPTFIISDIPFLPKEPAIEICYSNPDSCNIPYHQDLITQDQEFVSDLQKYTDNFTFIDTLDNFCDEELCHLGNGGLPIYTNRAHITGTYSESMGPWFVKQLQKLGL